MQKRNGQAHRSVEWGMAAVLLAVLLFFGCAPTAETVSDAPAKPDTATSQSFMGKPMPDLAALAEQKQLKHIDLRGHAIALEQIEALKAALPDCEILYSLSLGGNTYACTAETLRIRDMTEADFALLPHFPNLKQLDARGSDCIDALEAYAAAHPDIFVRWTVPIGAKQIDHDAAWVDLSFAELPDTDALIEGIGRLRYATDVNLVGCALSREQQALLLQTFPDLRLYWTVEVDGKQFKNTETRLDFNTVNFDGAAELAAVVACFRDPQWVDVATHGFESAEMMTLSEQFPNTEFVWTVRIGGHIVRTDIEVFYGRSGGGDRQLRDEDIDALRYCRNLRAVNLYRNMLSDLSPLAELDKLEVLILSHNKISDLSPLAGLTNLRYLEAHNNRIVDISPLGTLTALRDVNLMFNDVRDFSALTGLVQLERAYLSRNEGLENGAWQAELTAALPKAQLDFDDSNTRGWQNHDRYDLLDRIWTSRYMEPLYE